eukprot:2391459-Amphidinium_carterae.1
MFEPQNTSKTLASERFADGELTNARHGVSHMPVVCAARCHFLAYIHQSTDVLRQWQGSIHTAGSHRRAPSASLNSRRASSIDSEASVSGARESAPPNAASSLQWKIAHQKAQLQWRMACR